MTIDKTGRPEIGAVLRYKCLETNKEKMLLASIGRGEFQAIYSTIWSENSLQNLWEKTKRKHKEPNEGLHHVKELPTGSVMDPLEHLNRIELQSDKLENHVKLEWEGSGTCHWK